MQLLLPSCILPSHARGALIAVVILPAHLYLQQWLPHAHHGPLQARQLPTEPNIIAVVLVQCLNKLQT